MKKTPWSPVSSAFQNAILKYLVSWLGFYFSQIIRRLWSSNKNKYGLKPSQIYWHQDKIAQMLFAAFTFLSWLLVMAHKEFLVLSDSQCKKIC